MALFDNHGPRFYHHFYQAIQAMFAFSGRFTNTDVCMLHSIVSVSINFHNKTIRPTRIGSA